MSEKPSHSTASLMYLLSLIKLLLIFPPLFFAFCIIQNVRAMATKADKHWSLHNHEQHLWILLLPHPSLLPPWQPSASARPPCSSLRVRFRRQWRKSPRWHAGNRPIVILENLGVIYFSRSQSCIALLVCVLKGQCHEMDIFLKV